MLFLSMEMHAKLPISYSVELISNNGSGKWAPYYIASNTQGTITQPHSELINIGMFNDMDTTKRFSYGFGMQAFGGYTSSVSYNRYDTNLNEMVTHNLRPSATWLQQLYADIKYRSMYITLGLKYNHSHLLNDNLSSGDITMSANSRPMPGLRAGLIDFRDIPYTNKWLQISGELGYFKPTDNDWLKNHYNQYSTFVTTDLWFNYKRIYFRTKPSQPFSFTIGMQASCQFGGTHYSYSKGILTATKKYNANFGSFIKSIIPSSGGTDYGDKAYKEGNHVGSWDMMGTIKLPKGALLKVYLESPWEDGSGIGKLNGFDGLYGIEYSSGNKSIINGAVVEYLDFTNQSGPIHWAPNDFPGTTIKVQATGADDYYNNYAYNGYQYYGMSIGSPFIKSPLYNSDGYLRYTDNRVRGFHCAVTGNILPELSYRIMASYRTSLGTPFNPSLEKRKDTSCLFEASYTLKKIPGLSFNAQLAIDRGSLYGDNTGGLFSIKYTGLLNL